MIRRCVLLACLALLGCPEEPRGHQPVPTVAPVPPFEFTVPKGFTQLRFGLVPHLSPESIKASRMPLAAHLSSQLHVPVELVVGDTYDDVGDKLARGEVDFAEFSPFAFVRARGKSKLQPLVSAISSGSNSSGGYIVVREDSPRRSLEDLKGASFAFVDPASASGFLYPMKLFHDRGIDPATFFASTVFLGNHEAVLQAVFHGEVEAGATWQGALTSLKQTQGIEPISFRVIGKTGRTPQDVYCAREGLDPVITEAISSLMLRLSMHQRTDRQILLPMNANGFVKADLPAYDAVAQVAASLDAGP